MKAKYPKALWLIFAFYVLTAVVGAIQVAWAFNYGEAYGVPTIDGFYMLWRLILSFIIIILFILRKRIPLCWLIAIESSINIFVTLHFIYARLWYICSGETHYELLRMGWNGILGLISVLILGYIIKRWKIIISLNYNGSRIPEMESGMSKEASSERTMTNPNKRHPVESIARSLKISLWLFGIPAIIITGILAQLIWEYIESEVPAKKCVVVARTNLVAGTSLSVNNMARYRLKDDDLNRDDYVYPRNADVLFGHKLTVDVISGQPIGWHDTDIVITNSLDSKEEN